MPVGGDRIAVSAVFLPRNGTAANARLGLAGNLIAAMNAASAAMPGADQVIEEEPRKRGSPFATITLQGDFYPEHLQHVVGR